MIVLALSTIALLGALFVSRLRRSEALGERLGQVEHWLRRWGPLVTAILSIAVVWIAWDALIPVPKVHDENSYLLQAEIFARGRWTLPSPPLPEFFEQPHVQVVPVVASKYPPGHALLLTLGALVGFPALVPLLLTGLTSALLFALSNRVTNPWVALLTWLTWISAPIVLRFQPGYFSEVTTTLLVLGSWWSLLEWRLTRRTRWIAFVALAVGWGALTRPLTMLAFAIPIGIVVIRDVVTLRLWRDLGIAFAVGLAVLSILPLWSARTTGDWKLSPIEKYRLDYLPFDKMGFTPDTTPPRRGVNPVLKSTYDYFLDARKQQRVVTLPQIFGDRLLNIAIAFFQGARLPLLPFAVAGLLLASAPVLFGALSTLVLFIAYLPYAHWAPWTIYYLEAMPLLACVTALGIWRALERLAASEGRARAGAAFVTGVLVVVAMPTIVRWRRDHETRSGLDRAFAAELKKLPPHSIVFIKYSPRVVQHMSVVLNYPDLDKAPVWVVHDLGARNEELRRIAPDRASFDFDEDQLVNRRR